MGLVRRDARSFFNATLQQAQKGYEIAIANISAENGLASLGKTTEDAQRTINEQAALAAAAVAAGGNGGGDGASGPATWVISATDRKKFNSAFKSLADPATGTISGKKATAVLVKTKLYVATTEVTLYCEAAPRICCAGVVAKISSGSVAEHRCTMAFSSSFLQLILLVLPSAHL